MSQHHASDEVRLLNPNIVALILISIFGIVAGLIYANTSSAHSSQDNGLRVAVVVTTRAPSTPAFTPTDTPTVTNTVAATQTPMPTNTSIPADTETTNTAAEVVTDQTGGAQTLNTTYAPELVAHGEAQFVLCAACHGPDARGIPNLGKDLVASEFVAGLTDEELVQFIATGRPIWDPMNTTGIDMPAKGGNPAMTTEDMQAIVAYLRTLSAGS